jgi:hypothetical protein
VVDQARPACTTGDVDPVRADLKVYYDDEAAHGRRGPASGRRVELLDDFIGVLVGEGRQRVFDLGAGP